MIPRACDCCGSVAELFGKTIHHCQECNAGALEPKVREQAALIAALRVETACLRAKYGQALDLCKHIIREDNDGHEAFDDLNLSDENGKRRTYRAWARRFVENARASVAKRLEETPLRAEPKQ